MTTAEAPIETSQIPDELTWAKAVEVLRDNYDTSYTARTTLAADLRRHATRYGLPCPQVAGSEAVLQQLIRYPQLSAGDARGLIEDKVSNDVEMDELEQLITTYGAILDQ